MSFVTKQLTLNSSPPPSHQFKTCAKCGQSKPPEGGIDMTPTRWICAACWVAKASKRKT